MDGHEGREGRLAAHGQDEVLLLRGLQTARPFELIVNALLTAGVSVEHLLLVCAEQNLLSPANILIKEHGAKGTHPVEGDGRTAREVGGNSSNAAVKALFSRLGAYLGRYAIVEGLLVHRSATCVVLFAIDLLMQDRRVALKLMRDEQHLKSEIALRLVDGVAVSSDVVVGVLGWHTPAGVQVINAQGKKQETERVPLANEEQPTLTDYAYVLVMERGERSLHDACAKERLAGYDRAAVLATLRSVAECLSVIHAASVVHGDLKPRNILRTARPAEISFSAYATRTRL